jgi:hypothetical protein
VTLYIKFPRRSPDSTADIYGSGAVAMCPTCEPLLGVGYPLWGAHLQAAIGLHAAHRAVEQLRDVPAMTDDDRRLGRRLTIEQG